MEKQAIVTTIMSKLRGFKAPACPKLQKIDITPALKGTRAQLKPLQEPIYCKLPLGLGKLNKPGIAIGKNAKI